MSEKEAIETFKQGKYLMVSTGEFSGYCVHGVFRILKDFDAQEQMILWAKETNRELINGRVESDYSEKISYLPWLNKNGFVEAVNYRELHTDDCGATVLSEY